MEQASSRVDFLLEKASIHLEVRYEEIEIDILTPLPSELLYTSEGDRLLYLKIPYQLS